MNIKFKNALERNAQRTPPVWFMRQAGRYHSHYRALREKNSFVQLCKEPELAAQVALGPIEAFDYDVAILFSDILFPLESLGMGLEYTEQGPRLGFSLDAQNMHRLKPWKEALPGLEFQRQALRATRELLPKDKSLIGFIGGPWTLFVYAVEGSHAGSIIKAKSDPALFHGFLETAYPLLKANIQLQLESGAEIVMLFDTAAGEVSPLFFQTEIQPVLTALCKDFPGKLGYYSKGTQKSFFQSSFLEQNWAGVGVDHRWDLKEAFSLRSQGFIQGNFDQALLFQETSLFKKTLNRYLETLIELSPEQRAGWVCGLGHGVLPKTPEYNVKYFVERVREVFA